MPKHANKLTRTILNQGGKIGYDTASTISKSNFFHEQWNKVTIHS